MVHSILQQTFNTNGNNLNKMMKVLCIMGNGKMKKNVVKVNKSGEMVQYIKEHFKTTWPTVLGDLSILAVMFIKANGLTIKLKEKVCICILMDQCILENGSMINSTVMVNKNGLTGLNMKEILKMGSNKVTESFFGLIDQLMKDSFILTKLKDMESMFGLTKENMKVFGKIIRCMERVYLPGLTEEVMKATILLTKSKARAYLSGQTEDHMMANGKTVSKKVKEFFDLKMEPFVKEFGRMVRKSNGQVM